MLAKLGAQQPLDGRFLLVALRVIGILELDAHARRVRLARLLDMGDPDDLAAQTQRSSMCGIPSAKTNSVPIGSGFCVEMNVPPREMFFV